MKKTCISLCLIVFAVLQAYAASSWKETRTVVFTPAGSEKTHLLQPDQSISETVTFGQSGIPTRKFLRVIGGVKMLLFRTEVKKCSAGPSFILTTTWIR